MRDRKGVSRGPWEKGEIKQGTERPGRCTGGNR